MSKFPYAVNDDGTITIGEGNSSFTRQVVMLNPTDRSFYDGRSFVLWFGAYGPTRLHVYARHLEDALDACVDWIADHAPGLLCDEQVREEYEFARNAGMSEDEAMEHAEIDTTCAGNSGHYLASWEWGIALENPTGKTLRAYVAGEL